MEKLNLLEQFLVISPQKSVTVEANDQSLYARLDEKYDGFNQHELVACHHFETSWSSWEIHPNGDEVVVLLAGQVTFVLDLDSGEQRISLTKLGDSAVVPKNVWHTAETEQGATVLFVTPGEGTQGKAKD